MPIARYPLRTEADLPRILNLVGSMPLAGRHVIDLPWRLSALDINEGCDAAFWEDDDGQVIGFAACQYVWAALDFFILPGPEAQSVAALHVWWLIALDTRAYSASLHRAPTRSFIVFCLFCLKCSPLM